METLVASAILMGVLVPAVLFLGQVTGRHRARDRITAWYLAVDEIENMASVSEGSRERDIEIDAKYWTIRTEVEIEEGLALVRIVVLKGDGVKEIAEIKTLRLIRDGTGDGQFKNRQ